VRSEEGGHHTPQHEFDLWCEVLRYELSQLPNLEHILILGNEGLRALTPFSAILQWRGSIVEVSVGGRDLRCLASINPAMVLRAQRILKGEEQSKGPPLRSARRIFEFDCHKFKLLTQGKLSPYVITEHINPTYAQACDFIEHCKAHPGPVALDIETINGETACIGLATDPYEGLCINFIDPMDGGAFTDHFTTEHELDIRLRLQRLLATPTLKLVAQNGMFDTCWLWWKDRIRGTVWYDTLLGTSYALLRATALAGLPHFALHDTPLLQG
jgi:hypothetical protein